MEIIMDKPNEQKYLLLGNRWIEPASDQTYIPGLVLGNSKLLEERLQEMERKISELEKRTRMRLWG